MIVGPLLVFFSHQVDLHSDWRTAARISSGISPAPKDHTPAVIEIFAARTYNWRGLIAVHTWIAMKPKNATHYTVCQVIGWRMMMGLPILSVAEDVPDRFWFGAKPVLLHELRGEEAEKVIPLVVQAIAKYPFQNTYNYWPGPNSNTFPAYVAREVPALKLVMPPTALGKDYLGMHFFAKAPSGTGYQISIFGMMGIMLAKEEGLEINFLGLVFGVNPQRLAIVLPGIGDLSFLKNP